MVVFFPACHSCGFARWYATRKNSIIYWLFSNLSNLTLVHFQTKGFETFDIVLIIELFQLLQLDPDLERWFLRLSAFCSFFRAFQTTSDYASHCHFKTDWKTLFTFQPPPHVPSLSLDLYVLLQNWADLWPSSVGQILFKRRKINICKKWMLCSLVDSSMLNCDCRSSSCGSCWSYPTTILPLRRYCEYCITHGK